MTDPLDPKSPTSLSYRPIQITDLTKSHRKISQLGWRCCAGVLFVVAVLLWATHRH